MLASLPEGQIDRERSPFRHVSAHDSYIVLSHSPLSEHARHLALHSARERNDHDPARALVDPVDWQCTGKLAPDFRPVVWSSTPVAKKGDPCRLVQYQQFRMLMDDLKQDRELPMGPDSA